MTAQKNTFVWLIAILVFLTPAANAQAPASIAGDGFLAGVTSGVYPLASYGYYIFVPADSGNSYQTIGIYNVNSSSGTYTYVSTNSSTALMTVNDSGGGQGVLKATFLSSSSGSYYEYLQAYPYIYQNGEFGFSSVDAPDSLSGRTCNCSVINGLYPFSSSGSYSITIATSGNTYSLSTGQSGTYSYSKLNRSTGVLQLNDSVTGSSTAYFGFSSATGGGFALKQVSGAGFQVGTFTLIDTGPPIVGIQNPTPEQRWSNSLFTVTGQASDNVQVTSVYYQINGQGWNLANTANSWNNWSGNVTLVPGTNVVQAYALDSSGNSSLTSTQSMFYVLPAPISVQINGAGTVSPNYNGQMLELGRSYSMTAAPGPDVIFSGWTGSISTGNSVIQFVMTSNLVLQANFVDPIKPIITITSPYQGQLWSNELFVVTGNSSDNILVSNVFYSLNKGAWTNAATVNNWTNWAASVSLVPGTNTIDAYAVDMGGNISTINSKKILCALSSQLEIATMGKGTISPNYSNAFLVVGKNYKLKAKAAKGYAFRNWTVSTNWINGAVTNNVSLNFTMAKKLTLLATFADVLKPTIAITNPVANQRVASGSYTVNGKAGDNEQVTNVWIRLNSGIWASAKTGNGWTNWTADLVFNTGTNKLFAYAVDAAGNCSLTSSVVVLPPIWVGSDNFSSGVSTKKWKLYQKTHGLMTVSGVNGHASFLSTAITGNYYADGNEQNAYMIWNGKPTADTDWTVQVKGRNSGSFPIDVGACAFQFGILDSQIFNTGILNFFDLEMTRSAPYGSEFTCSDTATTTGDRGSVQIPTSANTINFLFRMSYFAKDQHFEAWFDDTGNGNNWQWIHSATLDQVVPGANAQSQFLIAIIANTYSGPLTEGQLFADDFSLINSASIPPTPSVIPFAPKTATAPLAKAIGQVTQPLLPPLLKAGTGENQTISLELNGIANQKYVLQSTASLTQPIVWQNIITNSADGSGFWHYVEGLLPEPQKYYRVVVP